MYKIIKNIPFENITTILYINDNGEKFYIPEDEFNNDYQQYLTWLEEGNTPEEWNPEVTE